MVSKKSSSSSSTSASMRTRQSPNLARSPGIFEHSFFAQQRPKTTTTTPSPLPDPNEYEKSTHHNIPLTDGELTLLKEHVRLLNGLPPTVEKMTPRIETLKLPKRWPRPTLTSEGRAQLQQRRMIVRCGSNLKAQSDKYERATKSSDPVLTYRQLRHIAMAHTNDEMELLSDSQELENLRLLAERAKMNEAVEYRDNEGSRLRFKFVRGEPIISSTFRKTFEDFAKPPFSASRRICWPKMYGGPQIDGRKEIWLVPVDDDSDIPLHTQPRTPVPEYRRSRKERARQPLKKGKRTPMAEWKSKTGAKPKRPPWNFFRPCTVNVGFFK